MGKVMKRLTAVLTIAGVWGMTVFAQQTGPVIIQRDPTSPAINEGLTGRSSAGFKQNVNPYIGQLPASYIPFHGIGTAIASLVAPFSIQAPSPANPSAYGFKPSVQQVVPYAFSQTGRINRLYPGYKGIGGKNVTDVARLGTPGGQGPGDPYWVGYPRPGNVETPPFGQTVHHPYDCFCRWNEVIKCPLPENIFWHVDFGAPWFPPTHLTPVPCQVCFGVDRIRKHDFYVGTSKGGVFDGYPFSYPADTGYQECLTQSIESYAGSGPGGAAPGEPELYGL